METEAITRIMELVTSLSAESEVDSDTSLAAMLETRHNFLEFRVTKLVKDILAYCHRRDFPEPLIYTVVEMIMKRFEDELAKSRMDSEVPISKVKMGDTEYSFDTSIQVALSKVDLYRVIGEELFNSLKPKLNLYRRIKSL